MPVRLRGTYIPESIAFFLPLDFVRRAWTGSEEVATNEHRKAKGLYLADLRQVNPLPNRALL